MPATPAFAGRPLHPLHAILLAFPIALFATALTADVAYLFTAEMQWSNFASWAIAGALLVGAAALLWAVIDAWRDRRPGARGWAYPGLLALMWLFGIINAFQHSRDAWSSVGTLGLTLSILSVACALAAGWVGHSHRAVGGTAR